MTSWVAAERVEQRTRPLGERVREDHRHPLDVGAEHLGQPVGEVAADHDVVRRGAGHRQHGVAHASSSRSAGAFWSASASRISPATSSGVRPSVSTTSVATDS